MVKVFITKRILNRKEKMNVLWAVYQSYSDFKCRRKGASEVGRLLKLAPSTVDTLIIRFEK